MKLFDEDINKIKINDIISLELYSSFIKLSKITLKPINQYKIRFVSRVSPKMVKKFFPDTTGTLPNYLTLQEFSNIDKINEFVESWIERNDEKIKIFLEIYEI